MANTISNTASSSAAIATLLRTQSMAVTGLKMEKEATQAIVNQLQTTVTGNSATPSSEGGALPRGSLVDVLV